MHLFFFSHLWTWITIRVRGSFGGYCGWLLAGLNTERNKKGTHTLLKQRNRTFPKYSSSCLRYFMCLPIHLHYTVSSVLLSLVFSCTACSFLYLLSPGIYCDVSLFLLMTCLLFFSGSDTYRDHKANNIYALKWTGLLFFRGKPWIIFSEFPLSPCLIYFTIHLDFYENKNILNQHSG